MPSIQKECLQLSPKKLQILERQVKDYITLATIIVVIKVYFKKDLKKLKKVKLKATNCKDLQLEI